MRFIPESCLAIRQLSSGLRTMMALINILIQGLLQNRCGRAASPLAAAGKNEIFIFMAARKGLRALPK
jgi:hypothetical protein